jgi:hypothetical protein
MIRGSNPDRRKGYLFSKTSRPALGHTQPPLKWIPRAVPGGGGGVRYSGSVNNAFRFPFRQTWPSDQNSLVFSLQQSGRSVKLSTYLRQYRGQEWVELYRHSPVCLLGADSDIFTWNVYHIYASCLHYCIQPQRDVKQFDLENNISRS